MGLIFGHYATLLLCSPSLQSLCPLIIGNYSPVWSTGSHRQSIWWTIWSLCCNSVWRHPGPEENNGRISHGSFHYRTCWLRLNQDEHVWFLYHKQNRIGKRLFWFRLGSIPNSNSTWNRKPRVSQANDGSLMVHKHCNYWTDNLELFSPSAPCGRPSNLHKNKGYVVQDAPGTGQHEIQTALPDQLGILLYQQ